MSEAPVPAATAAAAAEPELFEYIARVTFDPSVLTHSGELLNGPPVLDRTYPAIVTHRLPEVDRKGFSFPEGLWSFALPEGCRVYIKPPQPSFHMFVLTNVTGARYYGYCVRTSSLMDLGLLPVFKQICGAQIYLAQAYSDFDGIPSEFFVDDCLVLISSVPMHIRWEQILVAFSNTLQPRVPILPAALHALRDALRVRDGFIHVGSITVPAAPPPLPWTEVSLRPLLRHLDPLNVIRVFGALLLEHSCIFTSDDSTLLSPAIEAAHSLLAPIEWAGAYIPILPAALRASGTFEDMYDAPMPFIFGIPGALMKGSPPPPPKVVLVNLDTNEVRLPPDCVELPARLQSRLYEALVRFGNLFAYHHPDVAPRAPPTIGISSPTLSLHEMKRFGSAPLPGRPPMRGNLVTLKTVNALYSSSSGSEDAADEEARALTATVEERGVPDFAELPRHRVRSMPYPVELPQKPAGPPPPPPGHGPAAPASTAHPADGGPAAAPVKQSTHSAPTVSAAVRFAEPVHAGEARSLAGAAAGHGDGRPLAAVAELAFSLPASGDAMRHLSRVAADSSSESGDSVGRHSPLRPAPLAHAASTPAGSAAVAAAGEGPSHSAHGTGDAATAAAAAVAASPSPAAHIQSVLRKTMGNPLRTEPDIDTAALRKVFVSVLVTLLRPYMAFLTVPDAPVPRGAEHVELFDREGFVAEAQEDCHEFLRALCATQLFEVFLQQRISHKRGNDDPFERLLRLKNVRRAMRLESLAALPRKEPLLKQTGLLKLWKKRMIHLVDNRLSELEQAGHNKWDLVSSMALEPGRTKIVIPVTGKFPTEFPFEVSCNGESFLLCAPDSKTRRQWIRLIKAKTSRDSLTRTLTVAPALVDMLNLLESNRRRTVAVYQSRVVQPAPPCAPACCVVGAAAAPAVSHGTHS